MNDDGDNIKRLNIRYKEPPKDSGPELQIVQRPSCDHKHFFVDTGGLSGRFVNVTYLIREGETEVECGNCGVKLDPMWVLKKLATDESRWNRSREIYQEEMARLNERKSTKCRNCGKMTPISRR